MQVDVHANGTLFLNLLSMNSKSEDPQDLSPPVFTSKNATSPTPRPSEVLPDLINEKTSGTFSNCDDDDDDDVNVGP